MSAVHSETRIDLDEILHQSVVDDEFRAQLMADPSLLGLGGRSFTLPTPIEAQDSTGLDSIREHYYDIQMGTCSYSITILCDTCK